mmetsp:Transcript_4642/g.7444  ORF Transcript_4642/g.7444 Transcript_4642/m.7444 type:complete len:256 (+) Transcript_4642:306-1073(+)
MRECVECRAVGLTGRVVGHPEWHFCEECWEEMTYLRRMPVVTLPCPSAMSSPAATQAGAATARAIEPPLIHTPQKHDRSSSAGSPLAAPDAVALTGTGTAGGLDEQIEVLESSAQNTTPLSSHELPKHLCSIHPTGVALCHDEPPTLCSHTGHPRELFSAPGTLDDYQPAATSDQGEDSVLHRRPLSPSAPPLRPPPGRSAPPTAPATLPRAHEHVLALSLPCNAPLPAAARSQASPLHSTMNPNAGLAAGRVSD